MIKTFKFMPSSKLQQQAGFTLLELLLATAVLGGLMVGAVKLTSDFSEQERAQVAGQQLRQIVDSLEERNLCKTSLYDCVRFQDEKKFHKAYKQIEQIVGFWVKDKSSADLLTSEILLKIGEMQNE